MDADLAKMRRYMLHHRIATYALVLFLVLITFILISISKQVEEEQAMLLDSQASGRTQSQTNGRRGSCPASGMPARITYDGPESRGSSSCYFGQFRYAVVRCSEGEAPQFVYATSVGTGSRCADKADLIQGAKDRCGCNTPTAVPTRISFPTPAPSGRVMNPSAGPSLPPLSPTRVPPPRVISLTCNTGVISHTISRGSCDDGYGRIAYTCLNGVKGVFNDDHLNCDPTGERLYNEAVKICKDQPYCLAPKATATPRSPQ